MSELENLVQEIVKFKQNVSQSNKLYEKLDKAIEATELVADSQRSLKDDVVAKFDELSKQNQSLEKEIKEIGNEVKKQKKLNLILGCGLGVLGVVSIVLLILILAL